MNTTNKWSSSRNGCANEEIVVARAFDLPNPTWRQKRRGTTPAFFTTGRHIKDNMAEIANTNSWVCLESESKV